jgi:outer membrane protein assembly factor BamB
MQKRVRSLIPFVALTILITGAMPTAAQVSQSPGTTNAGSVVAKSKDETGTVWPQHRGNAGSTGVSTDGAVKPPLRLVWSYRCDSDTTGDAGAGLTVAGGKVFCNMEMTKSILALDAETGAFCWEFFHTDVHYQQTSSFADGKLFVWLRGYGRSTLVALDAETGQTVWSKKLGSTSGVSARRSGPAIASGKVLVADGDGINPPAIICFAADTGEEIWRQTLDPSAGKEVVAPSIAAGKVFTGTRVTFRRDVPEPMHGAAVALDLNDGHVLWRNTDLVPTQPLVSDGKIAIVKFNGQPAMPKGAQKLSVLDAATGKELWSVPIWVVYGTTTITDDKVILKYYGAQMIAYDRDTGKKLWESRFGGGSGCSSPSISGKYAFVGTGSFNDSEGIWAWRFTAPPHFQKAGDGAVWSFHAVDLTSGESVWHCVTGNNACGDPAIAYGKLYLNSRDGRIYCYAPVDESQPSLPDSPDKGTAASPDDVRKLLAQQLPPTRPGQDWPTEGGTLHRAGIAAGKIEPPLNEAWTLDTGGRIISSPVVAAGKAFVSSLSGKIVCADLQSGEKQWEFQTGGEIKAAPAVADGVVYCGSDDAAMYAIDAASGRKLWQYTCGGPVQCSPAVAGGVVFFGANDYHFYALDRRTGKKLWSFKTEHPLVITTPVVDKDTVYMAQWVDWVYALDAATGQPKWRDCVPISIESLHLYRSKLYLRSARQIAEYDASSGQRLRLANAVYGYNGLGFFDNLVITAGIGSVSAVDLNENGVLSRYQDQPAIKDVLVVSNKSILGWPRLASMGTPLVIGDLVCFASIKGEVVLVRPNLATATDRYLAQQTVWSAKLGSTCHSSPIFADGHLLIGCDDGRLYAFRQE